MEGIEYAVIVITVTQVEGKLLSEHGVITQRIGSDGSEEISSGKKTDFTDIIQQHQETATYRLEKFNDEWIASDIKEGRNNTTLNFSGTLKLETVLGKVLSRLEGTGETIIYEHTV